jgi:DNA-binding MarR family transcriptional regulator
MAKKELESAVIELTQAIGLLVRRVRAASASHELSLTESMALARLEREGPATTADLARAEGMRPQSMGTTVASLEERGFVERKPHPTDGRQMLVKVTGKGTALRKSLGEAKRTWLTQAIGQLTREEQEALFAAGKIMQRLVEL